MKFELVTNVLGLDLFIFVTREKDTHKFGVSYENNDRFSALLNIGHGGTMAD